MKELCIALCVLLAMSLTGLAQAEMRVVGYESNVLIGSPDSEFEHVDGEHYYLDVETDRTGETKRIEVDKDTYELYLNELEAEKVHHDNLWYVKAYKWSATAVNDAVDWITFWN